MSMTQVVHVPVRDLIDSEVNSSLYRAWGYDVRVKVILGVCNLVCMRMR